MHLNLFIAKRYLLSKKRQNAVNIISLIAIIGIAIGCAALIIVMSVFNGIDMVIKLSEAPHTPAVVIYPAEGKFIKSDSAFLNAIQEIDGVEHAHIVIQESTVAKFKDQMRPVILKGVDEDYILQTEIEGTIVGGGAKLQTPEGVPAIIAGYGVASELQLEFRKSTPILLYYPNRNSNSISPSALSTIEVQLAGVFAFNQEENNSQIYIDIESARKLLKSEGEETKIEIFAKEERIEEIKKSLAEITPENRVIRDKFEENSSFYSMIRGEKVATFMIMLFIMLIASFNIVASISMLMLDKRDDTLTYNAMGLTVKVLRAIFNLQGVGIIVTGMGIGFILGCMISYIQENFGIIKLGGGNYLTDAYPIDLQGIDLLIIFATISIIGAIAVTLPVRYLTNKWFKQQ
ncbi:MAG: ABC transporter permease [Marinifilaceae bacterium]|nr:ABC transporter permease [Marinifilaceae bacterium]